MDSQSKSRSKSKAAITCIKLLLHIFNFLYLIIGICVLAVGIWTQVELKNYMELTGLYYDNVAYIMIGVGVLIMLVAVGGFYCTAKDKIALLYMYGIFISLLAIIQIAAGIAGGAFAHKLDDKFISGLKASIEDHDHNMGAWNWAQQKLKCCGANSSDDWVTLGKTAIPASCYSDNKTHSVVVVTTPKATTVKAPTVKAPTTAKPSTVDPNITTTHNSSDSEVTKPNDAVVTDQPAVTTTGSVTPGSRRKRDTPKIGELYPHGCHEKIADTVNEYLAAIVGVSVGFVVLQVIGAVLACCLAKKTSKNNYEQIY